MIIFVKANTSIVASISFITNILLRNAFLPSPKKFFSLSNCLLDTIFYSTSFTFGCISAQYFKRTKHFSIQYFGTLLTRSLLLHTCLTLFTGINSPRQRRLSIPIFSSIQSDIFLSIITSIFHLITGFMINSNNKYIS